MGHVIKKIDAVLRIEQNADERIHIHARNMRLDLSLDEYAIFKKSCLEAAKKIRERHGINTRD